MVLIAFPLILITVIIIGGPLAVGLLYFIYKIFKEFESILDAIGRWFRRVFDYFYKPASRAVKETIKLTEEGYEDTKRVVVDVADDVIKFGTPIVKFAEKEIKEGVRKTKEIYRDVKPVVIEIGKKAEEIYEDVKREVERIWRFSKDEAERIFKEAIEAFERGVDDVKEFAEDVEDGIEDGIDDVLKVFDEVGKVIEEGVDFVKDIPKDLIDVGKDIISDLDPL